MDTRCDLLFWSPQVFAPFLLLAALCVSLTLGILTLKRRDNLSLTFLVISNLYPLF